MLYRSPVFADAFAMPDLLLLQLGLVVLGPRRFLSAAVRRFEAFPRPFLDRSWNFPVGPPRAAGSRRVRSGAGCFREAGEGEGEGGRRRRRRRRRRRCWPRTCFF